MKFRVKGTHIKHGNAGEKAQIYGPGDQIELSEKQAEPILHHLEPESSEDKQEKKAAPKAGKKRSIKERLLGKGKKKAESGPEKGLDDAEAETPEEGNPEATPTE